MPTPAIKPVTAAPLPRIASPSAQGSGSPRALVIVTLLLAILLFGVAATPPRLVPSPTLAWRLSAHVVTIGFAGLILLFVAVLEFVLLHVAL
jgi:hypothetical protein